uniref:EF-hand domain-containing protein n=2 Tax=Amphora coffeiformis TaxID=265554 RepID=A0A7S3KWW6_9STRA
MLTGDFLAPYLLSSVDAGAGMMHALKRTPIDALTWGNHEADIDHRTVCRHVREWPGIWINSNMQDHDAMEHQVPYHVIEMKSPDGKGTYRVGFIAVLSNDPKLYSQFKAPGAFGGATIEDPWETLEKYNNILVEEEKCDLVIPLEHLYVHENRVTCEKFDFPVILSGHDHHKMDTKINGTRVIKPGMDGVFATVLEIVFQEGQSKPIIRSNFVEMASYEPDPVLKAETDQAYDVLEPLRNTELAGILPQFKPLSSKNARGSLTSMGRLICSMLKTALDQTVGSIDAVILMGGNIRANEDYDDDAFFSLETLEAEIKPDEIVGIVEIPGDILAAGIESTHSGPPIPGWMQFDDGIREESKNGKPCITMVSGQPLDVHRKYRVATKIKDLTNGQSPPLTEYFKANMDQLPSKGDYHNIHAELMGFFARSLFHKLWDATSELIENPLDVIQETSHPTPHLSEVEGRLRHAVLDRDGSGKLSVEDIHVGLRDFLGLRVNDDIKILAKAIHSCADVTGDGCVTVQDFKVFCTKMPREYRLPRKWSNAFPDPLPVSETTTEASPEGADFATLEVFEETESPMKRVDTEATALGQGSDSSE